MLKLSIAIAAGRNLAIFVTKRCIPFSVALSTEENTKVEPFSEG